MKKIIVIAITTLFLQSCGSSKSTACKCVDELNSMNYTSSEYNKCLDIAIQKGASSPLPYFQSICDSEK